MSAAVVEVQAEPEPIPGKSGLQVIRAPMVRIYSKIANFLFLICFFVFFSQARVEDGAWFKIKEVKAHGYTKNPKTDQIEFVKVVA